MRPRLTYIGGSTALLEWRGLRLLTDPTFDPAGTAYELPGYTLTKTHAPAIAAADVGRIDAVLLSHDHHLDNLDNGGRALLPAARSVLTTADGADRLGGNAMGLEPWQQTTLDGLIVTATPARHGPAGGDRGPVVGFALAFADAPDDVVYVSGDTVWYEGVAEVAQRFRVSAALVNLGAAKVAPAGDDPLTFTAADVVEVARVFPDATLVALHFEGWRHLTETRGDVEAALKGAGLDGRVVWPPPGVAIEV